MYCGNTSCSSLDSWKIRGSSKIPTLDFAHERKRKQADIAKGNFIPVNRYHPNRWRDFTSHWELLWRPLLFPELIRVWHKAKYAIKDDVYNVSRTTELSAVTAVKYFYEFRFISDRFFMPSSLKRLATLFLNDIREYRFHKYNNKYSIFWTSAGKNISKKSDNFYKILT